MVLDCPDCQALVNATELREHYVHDDIAPSIRFTFAACPRCSRPFVASQVQDAPNDWSAAEQLFPAAQINLSPAVPTSIAIAYVEAVRCFRARAYTASAIMCRKALEGLCAEHGFAERSLSASLKAMRDAGQIESRLFEWADALRISGNEAAHGVSVSVSAQDASDIIDFTNALMEYVFTFRDRFDAFKARRQHQTETTS